VIALTLPSVGKVILKTTSWIGQDGMSSERRDPIEDKLVFEKHWRK